jgi:hypothetical protein
MGSREKDILEYEHQNEARAGTHEKDKDGGGVEANSRGEGV